MRITYKELVHKHGEAKANQIGQAICSIHGGLGFQDFKQHVGGIDCTGLGDTAKAKIEHLLAPEPESKDTKKKEGDK